MTVVVLAAAPLVVVMTLATWHWARAAAPRRID
ncbi:MAG: hypothetical protein QOG03_374, partial [Actinomycetota bacterium]|nr:hypothetical protein [Actinomycetota bacterium]